MYFIIYVIHLSNNNKKNVLDYKSMCQVNNDHMTFVNVYDRHRR